MFSLLARAAADAPGQVAVVTAEEQPTYADLVHDARRVAGALRARGLRKFAVVEPDAARILRLLGGAALAGAEPCLYQPDIAAAGLAEQAAALGHDVVVSRRTDLAGSFEVVALLGASTADAPTDDTPADDTPTDDTPADALTDRPQPLMIRTTGTTGLPKAARHDWRVLGRTVEHVRPRPGQRWLLAYGPQQFAGLQVLQHVAAARATLVAPFPRQPRDGLQALLHDRVTCLSATPTYWRFLLAEADSLGVALPALEQITLGGEASPPDLLAELERRFPDARISHVYASTEFGSIASVRDRLPGFPVSALHGEDRPDANLRVVEGELWVRARAGMLGYAGAPSDPPAGAGPDDEWRPTGDLVEVVDGRVLFRGRSSEVINVGGVKVHPLPVEERISALETVALARVFGRSNPLTGAVVAVEIVPAAGTTADLAAIRAQVRAAVSDLPPAWHPRSVKLVDTVETRGAKTLRRMEP
jgi:acyl-CoA synthetase (AMP-forming)/AMP-acid ligase II